LGDISNVCDKNSLYQYYYSQFSQDPKKAKEAAEKYKIFSLKNWYNGNILKSLSLFLYPSAYEIECAAAHDVLRQNN